MPGFAITGQENPAQNPASLNEVRRTHRWAFETMGLLNNPDVLLVLKSASRPSFNFEEPSMHHNQEQIYFVGKHTWEPISLSWYDVEQKPDVSHNMWRWLGTIIDLYGMTVAPPTEYKAATASLVMLDGRGTATESWLIYNGWPQMVNWNSLDYTSTDLQLVEVKYRYDRAVKNN
jgi:hypothetical protein